MKHIGSVGVVAWEASLGCYVSLYNEPGGAFSSAEEMAAYVEARQARLWNLLESLPPHGVTLAHACTDPGRAT